MAVMRTCCPSTRLLVAAVIGLAACARSGDGDGTDDPSQPGLAFAKVPATTNVNGRFQLWARINDADGIRSPDSETAVTIAASGSGTLRGTLTRKAIDGQVIFDDLVYDRWEAIRLTLTAPGFRDVTTHADLPVRPLMRFVGMPPTQIPSGQAVGPFDIELVDGRGQPVKADQPVDLDSGPAVDAAGGSRRNFSAGPVHYDGVILHATGARTLVWRSPGLSDLVHPMRVHDGQDVESLWLPAGRVGAFYRTSLAPVMPTTTIAGGTPGTTTTTLGGADEYRLLGEGLPRGLILEPSGDLHGVPTSAGHARLRIFAARGDETSVLFKADLSIYPASETATTTLDALDVDGPFTVAALDDTVEVPSRNTTVPVRVFYPSEGGAPAPGPFPLVVFHHGAVVLQPDHPAIYDRFDHLLRRWTSHGFVVATIDAPELVWVNGRLVSATLSNLNAMSEDQRATIAHLRARVADPAFPLAGHIDVERVIAAGHSRGGGASLITARAEESVVGGILLEPLDPLGTVGGEQTWNIPLPPKPFLLMIAGADGDLPYPMVDFLYERRTGPMVAPTIVGALHSWTCDASCPPDEGVVAGIPRQEDWAVTNAYAVAFLSFAARGDLSVAPLLFGREGFTTRLATLGTLVRSDRAAAPLVVDDFQADTAGRNRLGLASVDQGMTWSADEPSLLTALRTLPDGYEFYRVLYERPELQARSVAHRLQWTEDDASYSTALGGLDVSGRSNFVFRARTDVGTLPPERLAVRFRDAEGHTALVPAAGHVAPGGLGPRFSDFIVPLAELLPGGIDVTELDAVELVFRGAGTLLIDDLRFE
jgi:dienelactone hydrolase